MNWSKCLKLYHSVYNVWVSLFDDNLIYWKAFAINLLYSQELLIYQRFSVNSELLMKLTWQPLDCRTLTWSSYCICSQQNTEKRNLLYLRNIMAVKFLWGGYLWLVAAEAAADSRKKVQRQSHLNIWTVDLWKGFDHLQDLSPNSNLQQSLIKMCCIWKSETMNLIKPHQLTSKLNEDVV